MPLISPGVYVKEVDITTVIPEPKGWKDKLRGLYLMNILDRKEDNLEYDIEKSEYDKAIYKINKIEKKINLTDENIKKIIFTSHTNSSIDSPFEYIQGKA